MTKRFENKVVLVTGGTSGIGLETAKQFIAEGAKVTVTGSKPASVEAAQKALPTGTDILVSDAADKASIESLVKRVVDSHGKIDAVFINTGIAQFAPLADSTDALFDKTFDINVKGPWQLLRALGPALNDGAAVVLNTSIVDVKGFPGTSVYSASKAALRSIARTVAAEWSARGIRINAVSPGPIDTPIFDKMGAPAEATAEMKQGFVAQVPLGRIGKPEDVAAAALFLASTEASFITGSELAVDGGMSQL